MEKKHDPKLTVAAIRALVIDEINRAKSGHPGMALDAAPALYALFRDHLIADPEHPDWPNRDRFVLSSGHASSLLYALLHVSGYPLSMDDLKSFRQLGSKTPGHPEYGHTPGVDATSGPLGQGLAQAVGMAIAEKAIRSAYPEGERLCSHFTYCLCGDGDLQEGISQEAISLAGHLRLNKLIVIYDRNGSTLDGPTTDSLTEDIKGRFLASEWNVLEIKDGNKVEDVSEALSKAKRSRALPTLIIMNTIIGFGSEKQGTNKVHGEPLGEEDGQHAKKVYGVSWGEFVVPEEAYADLRDSFAARGKKAFARYQNELLSYEKDHRKDFEVYKKALSRDVGQLPSRDISAVKSEATRSSSGAMLALYRKAIPWCIGGSADVAGSTKTDVKGLKRFPEGGDMRYGIREFAMAAAQNGILLHGGLLSYCACFLVFSDYMKAAIRMAALEHLPAIYLFTHDSLAVGEDGPTHEPIEQLAALRAMPNLNLIRPADAKEAEGAYAIAFKSRRTPTAIALTRQALPVLEATDAAKVALGAYKVLEPKRDKPDVTIIATGSEVSLALRAADILIKRGYVMEVISAPCLRLLDENPSYAKKLLSTPYAKRVSLEMGSTYGWGKYAKFNIGVDDFGASGKADEVLAEYGFTPEKVAQRIASFLPKK